MSTKWSVQLTIPEFLWGKLNGTEIPSKKSSKKFQHSSRECSFSTNSKTCCSTLTWISRNLNQNLSICQKRGTNRACQSGKLRYENASLTSNSTSPGLSDSTSVAPSYCAAFLGLAKRHKLIFLTIYTRRTLRIGHRLPNTNTWQLFTRQESVTPVTHVFKASFLLVATCWQPLIRGN